MEVCSECGSREESVHTGEMLAMGGGAEVRNNCRDLFCFCSSGRGESDSRCTGQLSVKVQKREAQCWM